MEKLIGIPFVPFGRSFSGCDCSGLVILFYKEVLKIKHENYLNYTDPLANNEPQIMAALNHANFKKTTEPIKLGDLLVIRHLGHAAHLGICYTQRHFLHTLANIGSHLAEYEHPGWKGRIESRWRMI